MPKSTSRFEIIKEKEIREREREKDRERERENEQTNYPNNSRDKKDNYFDLKTSNNHEIQ